MNADITKVKNLILNDEEAMNYFILIAMFYSTQEEGKEERHREDEWLECKTLDDRFFYMNMKTGEKLPCGVQPIIRGTKND